VPQRGEHRAHQISAPCSGSRWTVLEVGRERTESSAMWVPECGPVPDVGDTYDPEHHRLVQNADLVLSGVVWPSVILCSPRS
jgi:hypothetical protein